MSKLVSVTGKGGCVRYDGVTSGKLLGVSGELMRDYDRNVSKIHQMAQDSVDLERLLQEFKAVGPTRTRKLVFFYAN